MADLSKTMEREQLHSEHAARCWLDARRRKRMHLQHDTEFEARNKLPRRGMWNRHGGIVVWRCTGCGNAPNLHSHSISALGVVTPSAVCSMPGCAFHEHLTLDGWVTPNV